MTDYTAESAIPNDIPFFRENRPNPDASTEAGQEDIVDAVVETDLLDINE